MKKMILITATALSLATSLKADELLSGPYHFSQTGSVLVKPAQLAGGWGMTLGAAFETVINETVTTGFEVDAEIPVVAYPDNPRDQVKLFSGGLRLGAIIGSSRTLHWLFNNTVGVGQTWDESWQSFLFDEFSVSGELNVTTGIRVFAGAGYRFTNGINPDLGLTDANARGLFLNLGIRYGEITS